MVDVAEGAPPREEVAKGCCVFVVVIACMALCAQPFWIVEGGADARVRVVLGYLAQSELGVR